MRVVVTAVVEVAAAAAAVMQVQSLEAQVTRRNQQHIHLTLQQEGSKSPGKATSGKEGKGNDPGET